MRVGTRIRINAEQIDDDDGTQRITPAGEVWQVLDIDLDSSGLPSVHVGCAATGATVILGAPDFEAGILEELR